MLSDQKFEFSVHLVGFVYGNMAFCFAPQRQAMSRTIFHSSHSDSAPSALRTMDQWWGRWPIDTFVRYRIWWSITMHKTIEDEGSVSWNATERSNSTLKLKVNNYLLIIWALILLLKNWEDLFCSLKFALFKWPHCIFTLLSHLSQHYSHYTTAFQSFPTAHFAQGCFTWKCCSTGTQKSTWTRT